MLPEPLHPAVVHFPIVLGVLLPFFAIGAVIMIRRGADLRPAWAITFALCAVLAVSAFAATRTGSEDEEIVEDVFSEHLIEEHEEAGDRFLWLSGAALALAALGFAPGTAGLVGRYGTAVGSIAIVAAGLQTGHLGGELVYEHGAAAAHVSAASGESAQGGDEDGDDEHEDDDEDDDEEDDD